MTATAMKKTRDFIIRNLQLLDPLLFVETPEKGNIKYVVKRSSSDDCEKIFVPIIAKLAIEKYKIFCRTRIREIYQGFHTVLGHELESYKTRPYAMFHSATDNKIKEYILSSFQSKDGNGRVLIVTVAFGMGVDCKGLNYVIHYGDNIQKRKTTNLGQEGTH